MMFRISLIFSFCALITGLFAQEIQSGHVGRVTSIAFDQEGIKMLSTSIDGSVILWDDLGRKIKNYKTPGAEYTEGTRILTHVAFSNNTSQFVVGGLLESYWGDLEDPELRSLNCGMLGGDKALAYLPNAGQVVCGNGINALYILNGPGNEAGNRVREMPMRSPLEVYSVSNVSQFLVYSPLEGIVLMDVNGNRNKEFPKFTGKQPVAVSPNGDYFVYGLSVYSVSSGEELFSLNFPVEITSVSKDGQLIAGVSGDKALIWNDKGSLKGEVKVTQKITAITISPDNKSIAIGLESGHIQLWSLDGNLIKDYIAVNTKGDGGKTVSSSGFSTEYNCVAFSDDGRSIAFGATNSLAKVWNLETNRIQVLDHGDAINDVCFSKEGKVLTGCADNTAYMWSANGVLEHRFVGHKAESGFMDLTKGNYGVSSVAFSADEKTILTGSQDMTAKLWDINGSTTSTIRQPFENPGVITSDLSANNIVAMAGYTGNVQISVNGQQGQLPVDNISSLEFSPDGALLATAVLTKATGFDPASVYGRQPGSSGHVVIWNTADWSQVGQFSFERPTIVTFSSSGQKILVGNEKGQIGIWSVNGEKVEVFQGHSAKVTGLDCAADGRYVSCSVDGTIKLWGDSPIAELIPADDNSSNFIVLTPDNYYFSTTRQVKGLHYVVYGKSYPFEQFDLQFNRPDIVLQQLGYVPQKVVDRYKKAYEKRLELNGISELAINENKELPVFEISNRNEIPKLVSQSQLSIFGLAKGSGLKRLMVTVNGVPQFGSFGLTLNGANEATVPISITLSQGKNRITVWVVDENGLASLKEQIDVFYEAETTKPNLFFVGIGSGKFEKENERYQLNASMDARMLRNEYRRKEGVEFGEMHELLFIDEEVSIENIEKVRQFLMQSKTDDLVVLFYSGHGILDQTNGSFYLSSYEVDFQNPKANGIPYELLEGVVDSVPSRKRLVLLDACNSGEFDKDPKAFALMQSAFSDLRYNSGAYIISSSTSSQISYASQDTLSVFTSAVIKAMKESETMLASQLKRSVTTDVKKATRGRQYPTVRMENAEVDFKVW